MDCSRSIYSYMMGNLNRGGKRALYFVGRYVSVAKLVANVEKCASALVSAGLSAGDTVTVALPNTPDAVYLVYACAKVGVRVNLVHPLVPFSQLAAFGKEANSKIYFLFDRLANNYAERLAELSADVVICGAQDSITAFERFFYKVFTSSQRNKLHKFDTWGKFLAKGSSISEEIISDGKDAAVIMHSSGTTDSPKSVLLSHESLNIEAKSIISALDRSGNRRGDAILAVLPMFHAFGLGCCIHCALTNDVTSVLVPRFSAKHILNYVKRGKVTILAGVPTMYRGLVSQKSFARRRTVRSLVTAFCGGDALSSSLKNQFDSVMERFGVSCRLHEGYGMTEIGGVFSANCSTAHKDDCNGKPISQQFFAEAFENGQMLPRGTAGELCLSSPAAMNGYLGDEQHTKEAFFTHSGKVWLKSGDYGYVDEDNYLHFISRIKRVVKVSGVNVFPAQVEKIISSAEGVSACAVKAVQDERKGQVLVAYVQMRKGAAADKRAISDYCRKNLDKWSCPVGINFVPVIPLTNMGKIDYDALT